MILTTKKSISITLPTEIINFLQSKSQKSISASITNILNEYRKFSLRQELIEDAKSDNDDVMTDFSDYLLSIEKHD